MSCTINSERWKTTGLVNDWKGKRKRKRNRNRKRKRDRNRNRNINLQVNKLNWMTRVCGFYTINAPVFGVYFYLFNEYMMLDKYTMRHMIIIFAIIFVLSVLLSYALVLEQSKDRTKVFHSQVVDGKEAMSDPFFIPIYIINLERSQDRKKLMEERITADVVVPPRYSVTYVKGVDGKNSLEMFYEPLQNRGQFGLWKSWVNVIEMIAIENHPFALVFEDDADARLPELFDKIKTVVEDVYSQFENWHVLFLGGRVVNPEKLESSTTSVKRCKNCTIWGTEAVLISRAGARKILADPIVISQIMNNDKLRNTPLIKNIDNYLSETDHNVFAVIPPIVNQDSGLESTVLTGQVF
jgi:GR25 family glycosyltransferase involved in LPS biosynthesis